MPQKYTGRIIIIAIITFAALIAIIPPGALFDFHKPWSKKLALKPGIDMAGGTKLVYEIKPANDAAVAGNLSEQVMEALKKRVDPNGVRNLVWRPQAGNRIEIQMPLSGQSEEAQQARKDYSSAQKQLEDTNVRRSDVIRAVERLAGQAQEDRFKQLSMGSAQRLETYHNMAKVYARVKAAEAARNVEANARAEEEYDKLKAGIEDTNLSAGELQAILDVKQLAQRTQRLDDVKKRFADFPARTAAIDVYSKAWDAYSGVKGQLDDAGELKRLLRGSGVLEFHIVLSDDDAASPAARAMADRLKTGKGVQPQAGDEMKFVELDRPEEMQGYRNRFDYADKTWALVWTTPDKEMVNRAGEPQWGLERANVAQTDMGTSCVGFTFDAQGAVKFAELTGGNRNKLLGAVLDDKLISAANIQATIGKSGVITRGNGYSKDELNYLINTLNAGSLPARLADEPISEQTVGPQLGQDNLRRGLLSCVIGLVVIGVFLIGYYHLAGFVAFLAVLLDVVLILGFMAAFDATFTLAGVAGVVLTICIAVDANVLIFERLREEQIRGMGVRMAVKNAYDRAFSAIFDSNVTAAITAFILYQVGSEEVKGFGLTLLLGMLSSMFTALFVTKTVFGLLVEKMDIKNFGSLPLTLPGLNKFLHPKIDWMGLWPWYVTFSALTIIIGTWAFVTQLQQGRIFDIEFASGTSVQFELKPSTPMTIEEVRSAVEAMAKQKPDDLPAPSVVSLGSSNLEYEVVSPLANAKKVKDAVIAAIGPKLNAERESHFVNEGKPIDVAQREGAVVAVTGEDVAVPGLAPVDSAGHEGGVAIILQNLDPMLNVKQIHDRIEKQRLQPQAGGKMLPYRDMDIRVAEQGSGDLVKTAVILISDSKYPHDKDPGKWNDELAGPSWRLINDAINNPAQLSKVTNFDAQVAGATQLKAVFALVLATIVIMLYIWFRFGDMKFGSASAVATLHDALVLVGAIGVSHYLADTKVGEWLMIEPFRINLTMVASILTVLGYSMNDTVVVFDRIRENRGRGAVTHDIVNTSINQTFSRTMLISGSAIVMVGIMYVYGGSGIHGFTFALLIGIIEGTYSSIAIASPLLLFRAEKQPASGSSRAVKAAPAS